MERVGREEGWVDGWMEGQGRDRSDGILRPCSGAGAVSVSPPTCCFGSSSFYQFGGMIFVVGLQNPGLEPNY